MKYIIAIILSAILIVVADIHFRHIDAYRLGWTRAAYGVCVLDRYQMKKINHFSQPVLEEKDDSLVLYDPERPILLGDMISTTSTFSVEIGMIKQITFTDDGMMEIQY